MHGEGFSRDRGPAGESVHGLRDRGSGRTAFLRAGHVVPPRRKGRTPDRDLIGSSSNGARHDSLYGETVVGRRQAGLVLHLPGCEDGSFCKHCVAVALSLDPDAGRAAALALVSARESASSPEVDDELADYVEQLSPGRLVEIVLEQAGSDWRLRERLLAEAVALRGARVDVEEWRRRIDSVFFPYRDFVPRDEEKRWAAGIHEVIDALQDLCDAGHPEQAAELVEYAHSCAERAIEYVYPAEAWLDGISHRLAEVHYRACSKGSPDPSLLAVRLVELDTNPELEGFYRAVVTYAEILGEVGLAAYRDHLESLLKRSDHRRTPYTRDYVEYAMAAWALATGNPDTVIEVYSRGRIYSSDVMEIVEVLAAAGREEEAMDWARRGLREYSGTDHHVAQLRKYLAAALRERGDSTGAVRLFWDAFTANPSLPTYRRLLEQADGESGVDGAWSQRSVEYLRTRLAAKRVDSETARSGAASWLVRPLLDILLYEGRIDEAWNTATEFGCDQQMWLTLARARERTHPLDAIAIYEPEVISQIERVKTTAYRTAVDLMERIRRLADAAGEPHRFTDLLDRVRTEHWRKRNLKKLLDDRGW